MCTSPATRPRPTAGRDLPRSRTGERSGRSLASGIEIARERDPEQCAGKLPNERRGGISAQSAGRTTAKGQILVHENFFRGNRGPDLLRRRWTAVDTAPVGPRRSVRRPRPCRSVTTRVVAPKAARRQSERDDLPAEAPERRVLRDARPLGLSRRDDDHAGWACIVPARLGLGPSLLHSIDGDPIAASAVFFVNRSTPSQAAPVHVTISNLRLIVPEGQSIRGVALFGHQITLSHLDIGGSPKDDDRTISGRGNGNSYARGHLDPRLDAERRRYATRSPLPPSSGCASSENTIVGVRDSPAGQPAAGIDVEPDDRGQPALDVRIIGNTISDNRGPGILLGARAERRACGGSQRRS